MQPTSYLSDLPADLLGRAAPIRLTAFDVDGTLTDGCLHYSADGQESKVFHAHDGLGIKRLQAHGIEVAFITARSSQPVVWRAKELGVVHLYQGQNNKRACLLKLMETLGLVPRQLAFTGDDLPDLPAMHLAGLAVAVANAHPWVLEAAHWQTRLPGGHGAVRELADLILYAQGKAGTEREHWR